jgi:hypothetical protein
MASRAQQNQPATNIAAVDIPPPGVADTVGVYAFRAGDEIPQAWLDEHKDYITDLEEYAGSKNSVVRRAPLSEAPDIAAEARGANT